MESRRLYRSEQDRVLGGVCGGLGAYLGVDPTIVRVVFVVLAFFSVGIVLYLVMWVIVPSESALDKSPPDVAREGVTDIRDRARQGAQEAREAINRLRGREQGAASGLVPEPRPAPQRPPASERPPEPVPEPEPVSEEPRTEQHPPEPVPEERRPEDEPRSGGPAPGSD